MERQPLLGPDGAQAGDAQRLGVVGLGDLGGHAHRSWCLPAVVTPAPPWRHRGVTVCDQGVRVRARREAGYRLHRVTVVAWIVNLSSVVSPFGVAFRSGTDRNPISATARLRRARGYEGGTRAVMPSGPRLRYGRCCADRARRDHCPLTTRPVRRGRRPHVRCRATGSGIAAPGIASSGSASTSTVAFSRPRSYVGRALTRIAHEILERNKGGTDVVLLGIPTRGVIARPTPRGADRRVRGRRRPHRLARRDHVPRRSAVARSAPARGHRSAGRRRR